MTLTKMGRLNVLALAALTLLWLAPRLSSARIFKFNQLDQVTVDQLPPAAQQAYNEAINALDHIDYAEALERLATAIKAAPESIELRFLAVNLARYRGEMTSGVEAARYFESAIENTRVILADRTLNQRDRGRAEYLLDWLEKQRKTIEERDEGRRTYGLNVAKQYAKEVYKNQDNSAEVKAFREAITQLTKPGSAATKATSALARGLRDIKGGTAAAGLGTTPPPGTTGSPTDTGLPAAPLSDIQGRTMQIEPGLTSAAPSVSGAPSTAPAGGAETAASPAPGGVVGADTGVAPADAAGLKPGDKYELPPPPPPDLTAMVKTTRGDDGATTISASLSTTMTIPAKVGPSSFAKRLDGTREVLEPNSNDAVAAKTFADTVLKNFFAKGFSFDELNKVIDASYLAGLPEPSPNSPLGKDRTQTIRLMFGVVSGAVGAYKEFKGSEGTAAKIHTPDGDVTVGTYIANVGFEKGDVPVYIEVIHSPPTDWKVRDINMDDAKVNEISGGALTKAMQSFRGRGAGGNQTTNPVPLNPAPVAPAAAAAPAASAPAPAAAPVAPAAPPASAPAPAGGASDNPFK